MHRLEGAGSPGSGGGTVPSAKLVLHVVGARPNFMKAAPVIRSLGALPVRQLLVHTGQHYDRNMSEVFFGELGLAKPDFNLDVRTGSHVDQIAHVMLRIEPVLIQERPDLVMVYGDVNSTLAAAIVSSRLGYFVAHVEAGLRSGDRCMPEEVNRLLTDQIADMHFTPSEDADENLLREGIPPQKIHRVGNVMIDTLVRLMPLVESRPWRPTWPSPGARFALATLHRPSNVDDAGRLGELVRTLAEISRDIPVLFPVHPRTLRNIQAIGLDQNMGGVRSMEPLGYTEFLALQSKAALVITDSGGIQEETTFLGVPCLTVRENTERPVTVRVGTNMLVGRDMERLRAEVVRILSLEPKAGSIPPLWDGRAAERIARVVSRFLGLGQ